MRLAHIVGHRFHRGRHQRFQIAQTHIGICVFRTNDFALFGQTDFARHTARRLRQNCFIRRPATTANRTATPVEEGNLYVGIICGLDQSLLRFVQRPDGGEETTVFITVRVAEHDFLLARAAIEPLIDQINREPIAHDRRRTA